MMRVDRIYLTQGSTQRHYYNSLKTRMVPFRTVYFHRGGSVRGFNLSESEFKRMLKIVRRLARRKAWAYTSNSYERWSANNGYLDNYQIGIVRMTAPRGICQCVSREPFVRRIDAPKFSEEFCIICKKTRYRSKQKSPPS